jgi:hypothetical protein
MDCTSLEQLQMALKQIGMHFLTAP